MTGERSLQTRSQRHRPTRGGSWRAGCGSFHGSRHGGCPPRASATPRPLEVNRGLRWTVRASRESPPLAGARSQGKEINESKADSPLSGEYFFEGCSLSDESPCFNDAINLSCLVSSYKRVLFAARLIITKDVFIIRRTLLFRVGDAFFYPRAKLSRGKVFQSLRRFVERERATPRKETIL